MVVQKDGSIRLKTIAEKVFSTQELLILIPLIILCIAAVIKNPNFMDMQNIGAMAKALAPWGLLAIGESLIIIGGEIDISVGSATSLGITFFGNAIVNWHMSVLPAFIVTVALTVTLSSINGYFVIYKKVPAFLSSIAMLYVCKGSASAITNGHQIMLSSPDLEPVTGGFIQFAQQEFFNLNWMVVFFIVLIIIFHFVLKKTPFGSRLYAVGDNKHVAQIAGIDVNKIKMLAYVISGCLIALAAIMIAGREGVSSPKYGEGWELTVIAATAIGGISLVGGSGTMIGTMIGAFIMAVISNVMILFQVNQHYQSVILGVIIVLSVILDDQRRKRLLGEH